MHLYKRCTMKRIVVLGVLGTLIVGCSTYNTGELVGVDGRKAYAEPVPHGMVPIPNGDDVVDFSRMANSSYAFYPVSPTKIQECHPVILSAAKQNQKYYPHLVHSQP